MVFFRKKKKAKKEEDTHKKEEEKKSDAPSKRVHNSLSEIVQDRVLSAEGWKRRTLAKVSAPSKKSKKS
jgi:hypothetical protein